MAWRVTGSASVCPHFDSPAHCGVPSPSHSMKDRTTTPPSGRSAKKPKKRRAGTAIRKGGPPLRRRLLPVADSCAATDPCVSVSVVISERGVHGVDELLRRDLQRSEEHTSELQSR